MVVTRGVVFPHIKFAFSTLHDKDLVYLDGEDMAPLGEKWKKYFESMQIPANRIFFMKQAHGNDYIEVDVNTADTVIENVDALITRTPGQFVAVKAADCLPILIFDPVSKVVAGVHAGWRGTAKEVLRSVVERLLATGSKKEDIHAVLAPSIGSCCYNVTGADDGRIEIFQEKFGTYGVVKKEGKVFLDIRGAHLLMLEKLGIPSKNIINIDECTASGVSHLPSYNKTKTKERFISVIGLV